MKQEYTTGKEFLSQVDELNKFIDKRANPHLLFVIQAEVKAYGDALRFELHDRLEKVVKSTETERLQAMRDLEGRVNKAIAENTRRDKIRFRWVMGTVIITIANLIALGSLYYFKLRGH